MNGMNYPEQAEYHADQAERLLAECRDGEYGKNDPYAPSAVTKAQAAAAHAALAVYFFGRSRP